MFQKNLLFFGKKIGIFESNISPGESFHEGLAKVSKRAWRKFPRRNFGRNARNVWATTVGANPRRPGPGSALTGGFFVPLFF